MKTGQKICFWKNPNPVMEYASGGYLAGIDFETMSL